MKTKIQSEEPISTYDLRIMLNDIKKRDTELGFRAAKTEEYLGHFAKLDEKKYQELKKKIEELGIPRLKIEHISKLVDIMPIDVEDVKLVLTSYSLTVTNENLKKIADVIKEYKK